MHLSWSSNDHKNNHRFRCIQWLNPSSAEPTTPPSVPELHRLISSGAEGATTLTFGPPFRCYCQWTICMSPADPRIFSCWSQDIFILFYMDFLSIKNNDRATLIERLRISPANIKQRSVKIYLLELVLKLHILTYLHGHKLQPIKTESLTSND